MILIIMKDTSYSVGLTLRQVHILILIGIGNGRQIRQHSVCHFPCHFQAQGNNFEKVLLSCFPGSTVSVQILSEEPACDSTEVEVETESATTQSSKAKMGMLETILQYGLRYGSASKQTWQVVQHPSK